jgi:hypothetical protein
VQPKNWLTTGVWTMAASAAAETTLEANTNGLVPPTAAV